MEQEKLDRISELYRKSQTPAGLTDEELYEQAELRREYIKSWKDSLTGQLDNTYVVSPDGSKRKLERKGNK